MNKELTIFYDFDNFRVNVKRSLLLKNNQVVDLKHKSAVPILVELLANRGKIVDKNLLIKRHLGNVTDNNLNQNISLLRKVLGDNKKPPFRRF